MHVSGSSREGDWSCSYALGFVYDFGAGGVVDHLNAVQPRIVFR
jgi:hypothetical protein